MEFLTSFIEIVLHLDVYLDTLVSQYGALTYGILFAIIFAETGLVTLPFLPGDSLLFAAGAIAAFGSLDIRLLIPLLLIAAILGDAVNYWIGHFFGKQLVVNEKFTLIKQEHIERTQLFYAKHGGKTIILARFIPIIRTFAPFIAGIGAMEYKRFFFYNVVGALLWILLLTLAGYFFGNLPFVRNNFHYVVFAIIGLSLVPVVFEFLQSRKAAH